jgi:hypothetical protein
MDVDAPHVIKLIIEPFAQLNCNIVKLTSGKLMIVKG